MGISVNPDDYLEGHYDGRVEKTKQQQEEDKRQAKQIAEEVEELYVENENRSDIDRYLVDGAILRCNQATLRPFKMSDGTILPIQYKNDEINDRRETEGAYATEKRDKRRQRLYTELHVTDNDISTGTLPNATVVDSTKFDNIPPFRCHCKLVDDRNDEFEKIDANKEDCRKNGVCQYLMRLNDRWKNLPRDGKNFYKTREASVTSEDGSGKERQTTEEVECITMTSMIFCRHGGLITPVFSGQVRAESDAVPQFPRVMRVSDKLIKLLKDYEGVAGTGGAPVLYTYQGNNDEKSTHTIGWGHAMGSESEGDFVFSDKIKRNLYSLGTTIEEWQAEELLMHDIFERENEINQKLEYYGIAEMVNQRFYDALFDLLYQNGTNHYGEDGDLTTFLTEGNFDLSNSTEIMYQFGEYSKLVCGSMCRRLDELDIIFLGDYTREDNIVRYGDIWGKKSYPGKQINWKTDIKYEEGEEKLFAKQIEEYLESIGAGGNSN